MLTSSHPLVSFWLRFQQEFSNEINQSNQQRLAAAWVTQGARTQFYTSEILPRVAARLELGWSIELFKVDAAMSLSASNGEAVPIVFIESENVASTSTKEMRKLCAVSSPLKVLITVVEWDSTPGVWPNGGRREGLLRDWQAIIKAHSEVWPQSGLIGILVGEWRRDRKLRFYSMFSMNGDIALPETVLLERDMGSSQQGSQTA